MSTDDGDAPVPLVARRVTVTLVAKPARELHDLIVETGMTRTDLVNRAVTLYSHVQKRLDDGYELLWRNPHGDLELVTLL